MEIWTEKFQQLKEEYINGIPERFSQIIYSLDQLEQDPLNHKVFKDLMRYFYGFASTGTTYGFPQITSIGQKGEQECEILLKNNLSPSKSDIERWRNYLLELKLELSSQKL